MGEKSLPIDEKVAIRMRRGSMALAVFMLVSGLLALAGYGLKIDLPGLPSLETSAQVFAATGFSLLGMGILAAHAVRNAPAWERASRRIPGWSLFSASIFLLAAPLFGFPARPDPLSAAFFALLGFALAAADARLPWIGHPSQWAAVCALFTGFFMLVAHLYHTSFLVGLSAYMHMPWPSAALDAVAGLSLLGMRPRSGFMRFLSGTGTGSVLARWLLPIGPLLIVGMGWGRQLGERLGLYPFEFGLALFAMSNVAWFVILIIAAAIFLNRGDAERRAGEEKIRRMNRELEEKAAGLEAANRELESFSYSVSHDLRAPLRHVSGFGEKLERSAGEALDGKSRHYLGVILESVARMGELIDDLLEFSRSGRAELRRSRVAMGKVVDEVKSALEESDPGRKVEWDIASLPAVEGDAVLLRQVWANLLGNAWKYTLHSPAPRIEVGCRAVNGSRISFQVRDNGAGFDMRHAGKLFGVFQRLHSGQEYEGTGIGLALVRRIVERHGGTVWGEGSVGAGASFGFTLPRDGKGKEGRWNG